MKNTFTLKTLCFIACVIFCYNAAQSQCNLSLSVSVNESRCKSTGSITATVTGGSGNYNYRITGAVPLIVTSSSTITGLPAGTYHIEVRDVADGCTIDRTNIVVPGSYQDPRFQLTATDVSCTGGSDGTITASGLQFGTAPFSYSIIAPSPSGVGVTNTSGVFTGLVAGNYSVRLVDSCGGIQTRVITIADYNWWIDAGTVARTSCTNADATITVKDNKGNYNTSGTAFNGYTYGVSLAPGDTVWYPGRSFNFFKDKARSVTLLVKDNCGNIRAAVWNDPDKPAAGSTIGVSNRACNDFTATVTGQANLVNPGYCLYTQAGILVSCNSSGVFDNVPYGSYEMRITDNCYDTTIVRHFTVSRNTPGVASSVTASDLGCSTFTATLTGSNLINPQWCIYDASNTLVRCQTTNGVFDNLPYGTYCITVTDGCTGTVFTKCITRTRPVPNVGATVTVSGRDCGTFNAAVTGQSNTTNVEYCMYDNNGILVTCNTTGQFDSLPYGDYCVHIKNDPACYDTTIVRCISVSAAVPSIGSAMTFTNATCSTFSASITTQANLTNPLFCLFDNANNQLSCNATGVFDNLPYGSYCIRANNDVSCYDTTIERCFTLTPPEPALSAPVSISDQHCTGFTATLSGQNLTNAQFCLYDNANNQVSCNGTGIFTNVPYGAYCIRVVNTCYDTTMERCFDVQPALMQLNVGSSASCTIGGTDLVANWTSTVSPFTIDIYNPGNTLVYTATVSSSTAAINGLAGLPAGMTYKVVIRDNCNGKDSVSVTPVASWCNKSISPHSKCPGGIWPNGSGDLQVSAQYSQGAVVPKIIEKNGAPVAINYNTSGGTSFTFSDMEPATYIVEYTLQGCSAKLYDTFELRPYSFPNLQQSAVYQCNDNSFGVSAAVNDGLSPFNYEIIGSIPDSPAIIAPPQASAVFNINNNNTYGLVRLRAIDVCGNATTNDASVLPLANMIISTTSNCFYNNITLTVDNIPNATYTWYLKTSATDSTQISNGQSHNIPYLLPVDTGIYVCKVAVNSGCLTRISTFNIDGSCDGVLPVNGLGFSGSLKNEAVLLQWTTAAGFGAAGFVVERSFDGIGFTAIGTVPAAAGAGVQSRYLFTDQQPGARNYYRLQVLKAGEPKKWSKVIEVNRTASRNWLVYPNPVTDWYTINFEHAEDGKYTVELMASDGRRLFSGQYMVKTGELKKMARPAGVKAGTYFLVVTRVASGERKVQPLVFK